MSLEDSFDFTPLNHDDDEDGNNESLLNNLNFEKFSPPALLTRHPPPATGRDDDITKLKQILVEKFEFSSANSISTLSSISSKCSSFSVSSYNAKL
jgi:hypothetical protein